MKNACAASRPPCPLIPCRPSLFTSTWRRRVNKDAGALSSPAGSFPEFPGFSISCQQNHNGSFPFHDPRELKTRTLPARKRAKRRRRCLTWLPSSSTLSKTAVWMQCMVIDPQRCFFSSPQNEIQTRTNFCEARLQTFTAVRINTLDDVAWTTNDKEHLCL